MLLENDIKILLCIKIIYDPIIIIITILHFKSNNYLKI